MDFRFSRFEIFTGTGSFFLCLLLICVFSEAAGIQEDLAARVNEKVRAEDLFWVSVDARGQRVVLGGAAADHGAKQAAGRVAARQWGVTAVDNHIAVIGAAGDCQSDLDEPLVSERISFRAGRAEIADESMGVLGLVAGAVRSCAVRVEIAVHTDSKGDADINRKLSQRRADALRKHLVQNGVVAERLVARGYGETQPIARNTSREGRSANRRVEFRVIGGAA